MEKLLFTLALFAETLPTTAASDSVLRQVNPKLWECGKSAKVLDQAGVLNWFALLSRDREAYFAARDTWAGLAELQFLASHAERVLWGFGFYLSPAGIQIRVDVGNEQKLNVVTKLMSGAGFTELG